jgi:hypothetical protein
MNKIKSMLFVAIFVAITATTTSIYAGHIPIGGRCTTETDETTAVTSDVATEPKNEISSDISDYLWTFADIIGQLKF